MALTLGTGRRRRRVVVDLYTRERCGLCEKAEERVALEARGAQVRLVDIDDDPALLARYHIRVPVIAVDGREVAEGIIEPGVVRNAIRTARKHRWSEWRRA